MKNIRKLVTVVLTLSLTLSLAACGSENSSNGSVTADRKKQNIVYRTLDEIKENGTINIGVFSDKNPFGYVDENGEYQGYDVYFANRIGEDLGVKINYVSTEAANRIEYLQTGKVDIILANFTVTPQRAEEFAKSAKENGVKVIIAAAGKAAHLGGVIAAYTTLPVIALPIKSSFMDGLDSLLSMVQMPTGIPVATVGVNGADNAGILAVQMLAVSDSALAEKLDKFKADMAKAVEEKDKKLQDELLNKA